MSDFSKPRLGALYVNYETRLLPFDVTVDFWRTYGVAPLEVIWAKPGMWLAGPVPAPLATTDDGSSRPASPELASAPGGDPPALEMAMVATPEQTEAAPVLEGQARLL